MGARSAYSARSISPCPRAPSKTVEKNDQALMPVMGYGATIKLVRTQLKRRLIASWDEIASVSFPFQYLDEFRRYEREIRELGKRALG